MSRREIAVRALGAAALVCALAGCGKLGDWTGPDRCSGPRRASRRARSPTPPAR